MTFLFISGVSIAIFLTLVLMSKPSKDIPDYLLSALLFFAAQSVLDTYLVYSGLFIKYPSIVVLGLTSPIAVAVLLFLYTKYQTIDLPFSYLDLLHFLPYVVISLAYSKFYFLGYEKQVHIVRQNGLGFETIDFVRMVTIYASGFVYSILSFFLLLRFRKNLKNQFSNTEKIKFNWLFSLIAGVLGVWLIVLIVGDDTIISIASTVFIILLGYFGLTQINVFSTQREYHSSPDILGAGVIKIANQFDNQIAHPKEQDLNYKSEDIANIHEKLVEVLHVSKPYTNQELTLSQLAKMVGTHPKKLSEVINKYEQKSFYDLINELRIQEFLTQIIKPENRQYTFMSLAYDCGFNSKASFNRNFKRYIGRTPTDYVKNHFGIIDGIKM